MDNRSSENAEWDKDLLNLELADLLEADFDLGLTGFTDDELNALMNSLDAGTGPQEGEDDIPDTPETRSVAPAICGSSAIIDCSAVTARSPRIPSGCSAQ